MRNTVDILKSESGREIFIYEVKNYKLVFGAMYEVEHKLGGIHESFESRLVSSTENDRTLIFNHPSLINKTIGIPNWNITKLSKI
jgi:hypothetical protein